jgi:mannose-6-phosphate isomerase-like protein (cupin superfamily)
MSIVVNENAVAWKHFPGRSGKNLIDNTNGTTSGFNLGVATYNKADMYPDLQVHDDQEAIYVISGKGWMKVGNQEVRLEPGTAVYVAPKVAHTARGESADGVKVIYTHGAI